MKSGFWCLPKTAVPLHAFLYFMWAICPLLILSFVAAHDIAEELRMKRQTYSLPHGSELLLDPLTTRFICRHDGYFADVDNNCRVYHICTRSAETRQLQRYSFLCGNLTMFNQLTLTCSRPEDSVPCRNAPVFYYVNDNIGYQDTPFLYDDDVSNADQFIHNNRLLEANPAAKRPF